MVTAIYYNKQSNLCKRGNSEDLILPIQNEYCNTDNSNNYIKLIISGIPNEIFRRINILELVSAYFDSL